MTTQALTMTDFLLARIAEDEYEANVCLDQYARGDGGTTARWHRQLLECKAKRVIVIEHDGGPDSNCGFACRLGRCYTLRAIAAVYADDPDYRDEWRIE